jgi:general secretion pathway protein K
MKISLPKNNRGIAVIVALVAITVLAFLAAEFAIFMKVETRVASNANNDEQMLWMGRAGVEMARYVVAQENRLPYDSLNQIWAGGPGDGAETNGPLMGLSMTDYPIGDTGTITVKIIDLERKVNVNSAPAVLLQQVLTSQGADAGDISAVSDSILDWIDADDATRPAGAESDYYQGQSPPYYAKNGPMDDISELLLVKGVTDAMYKGGEDTNNFGGVLQRHKLGFGHAPGEAPSYAFGLKDVLTPFSSGKVNINTADANVLKLIPGMDQESADAIVKYRAGPDGQEGTADDTPFQNPGQLAAAGVNPQIVNQIGQFITTKSTTFEVHVTAKIGELSREYVAVIYRNGNSVQTVGFYWK